MTTFVNNVYMSRDVKTANVPRKQKDLKSRIAISVKFDHLFDLNVAFSTFFICL